MGAINTRGVYIYDETDNEATHSELLNLGQQSLSDSKAYFAGEAAKRAALSPAPPGSRWQDTDNGEKLYSPSPTGTWRQHEGVASIPSAAWASSPPVYYRSHTLTLPTVISASESIELFLLDVGDSAFATVNPVVSARNVDSTVVVARLTRLANNATMAFTVGWRVVRIAS